MADALMREVDSAVKADKWRALWQQFGKSVAWATAIILLLTIGYVWFDGMRDAYRQELTGSILQAQQAIAEENSNKAVRILESAVHRNPPIGTSESSLRTLAMLQLSALPAHEEETHDAHISNDVASLDDAFGEVVVHPNTDIALKQLWQLMQLSQSSEVISIEDTQSAELLQPAEKGPFSSLVTELQAAILMQLGKTEKARTLLISLSQDSSLTQTQRQRVDMMMSQIPANANIVASQ